MDKKVEFEQDGEGRICVVCGENILGYIEVHPLAKENGVLFYPDAYTDYYPEWLRSIADKVEEIRCNQNGKK